MTGLQPLRQGDTVALGPTPCNDIDHFLDLRGSKRGVARTPDASAWQCGAMNPPTPHGDVARDSIVVRGVAFFRAKDHALKVMGGRSIVNAIVALVMIRFTPAR
jgi:hypothetical protein